VAKRKTAAEATLVTNEVYAQILKGSSRTQIIEFCQQRHGIKHGQADIYIKRARQLIYDDAQLSRPAFLAEVLAKTGKIYEMAEKKGQLQTMLNALRFACELTGIVK
jgi:hydroxyacyl-ACP dehydratase HTD2-like protein with hotdog domain